MKKMRYTWNKDWIQEYESAWSILEKFRFANSLTVRDLIDVFGTTQGKGIRKCEVDSWGLINDYFAYYIDSKKCENILGINITRYLSETQKKISKFLPDYDIFDERNPALVFCRKCMETGFHSELHRLQYFKHCVFHPEEDLKSSLEVDHNECFDKNDKHFLKNPHHYKYCYETKTNSDGKHWFENWKIKYEISHIDFLNWLALKGDVTRDNFLLYPISYYLRPNDKERGIVPFFLKAFYPGFSYENIVEIKSGGNIIEYACEECYLSKGCKEKSRFVFLNCPWILVEDKKEFLFQIYSQSKAIYKSAKRFIKREIDNYEGQVNLHVALANWINDFTLETYDDSIYSFSSYENKIKLAVNTTNLPELDNLLDISWHYVKKHDNANYTPRSINYIMNHMLMFCLIERFIYWLEVEINRDFEGIKNRYPSNHLIKIPTKSGEPISFYFQKDRFKYMRMMIKELSSH